MTKLTKWEEAYYNGYKQGRFDEYAESEQEENMELTYKQQTCPVCHGDVGLKDVHIDQQDDYALWIDGNKLQETIVCDACLVVGTNRIDGSTKAWDQPITINYCPMCGRPLNDEENNDS